MKSFDNLITKPIIILLILSLLCTHNYSQELLLEKYIMEGLENNLALRMKQDDYQQSLQSLRQAKGLFFPEISFNARYSLAGGGRMIEFPVGDLLNPVYSTLNQLTMGTMFPDIENQEFTFLRPQEHETKIRLVQPILSTDIYFNRRIKENMVESGKADMLTYRRALVAEIKIAWYNHLKAIQIHNILQNTKELLNENIRVNQSLYENDKVTRDVVYRSEAESNKLMQQIAEAEKAIITSSAYFNFLLNRELLQHVEIEVPNQIPLAASYQQGIENSIVNREELKMLNAYTEAARNNLKLQKGRSLPELAAVMDYGFQGSRHRFTGEDDFYMASLVLRWDLFKGHTNQSQITQAKIALDKIEKQKQETENAIQLQVINAWYSLVAEEKKIPAAESELRAAEQAFRLISRKYLQGQSNLIEFIDARNAMTNAETGLAIARYDYLAGYAEFEKAAGLYRFNE